MHSLINMTVLHIYLSLCELMASLIMYCKFVKPTAKRLSQRQICKIMVTPVLRATMQPCTNFLASSCSSHGNCHKSKRSLIS